LAGILYGLAPHTFCILFIVFTVLGATTLTSLLKPLLLNRYFFYLLIALSLIFATISAIIYLKKQGFITFGKTEGGLEMSCLSSGIKRKWKYLSILYGTTIFVNLIFFMLIFPVLATLDAEGELSLAAITSVFLDREAEVESSLPSITLMVDIPCPGHAPLISGELKTIQGVENVRYRFPNRFIVNYNPAETSKEQILALDVFNTYRATVIDEMTAEITDLDGFTNNGNQLGVFGVQVGFGGLGEGGCPGGCPGRGCPGGSSGRCPCGTR
jgi:hypothetical protein